MLVCTFFSENQQERKIIPCVYKACELPPQLTYFSKIYYKKLSPDFFWNHLLCSMKVVPSGVKNSSKTVPKKTNQTNTVKTATQNQTSDVVKETTTTEPPRQQPVSEQNESSNRESHRIFRLTGSTSFPFIKQRRRDPQPQPSTSAEGSANEESIPDLPSLTGLDSLSVSITPSECSEPDTNKKSKKKIKLKEKLQKLIAK